MTTGRYIIPFLIGNIGCDRNVPIVLDDSSNGCDEIVLQRDPSIIVSNGQSCEEHSPHKWFYSVNTDGRASSVVVKVYSEGNSETREESHSLISQGYSKEQELETWIISLLVVSENLAGYNEARHTLFTCEMQESLTWMVIAYDLEKEHYDCWAWGPHEEYYACHSCWNPEEM